MWTTENRARYDRSRLRYPSDLTDQEWELVGPLTGRQWRALPRDLPPRSSVHDYLDLRSRDGTLDRIHHALYVVCRERSGSEASPRVAIIDTHRSASSG